MNARFVTVDRCFAEMRSRIDELEHEAHALARRTDARFRSIDGRLDASRQQIDHARLQLSSQIERSRRELGRIVLLGLLATVVSTGGLCLGTIVHLL